ncbi:MAG: 5-formyltetrahydrofolate cyclo-ligase [Mariprofundales bacterium]|nr:5-formyltetrahydrofolate cyclo-ligase [Mariprofundales bacterium]
MTNKKRQLRQWGKTQRAALSDAYRQRASAKIIEQLFAWILEIEAAQLLIYRNLGCEVATEPLFFTPAHHITPFAPILRHGTMKWLACAPDTTWVDGDFGTLEPQSNRIWNADDASITVLACPLTAFDRQGRRIGMGKGYFDRWLSQYGDGLCAVVGLAFSCQEVEEVATEPHDQPLQRIFTEKESIPCH